MNILLLPSIYRNLFFLLKTGSCHKLKGITNKLSFLLLIILFPTTYFSSAQGTKPPNVLVILLDDARYDMFAPNGGPSFFNTPYINKIADEGVNFKYTAATTSLCGPSRASIYTGLYAHHHGNFDNTGSPKPGLTYVSQILQDAGYYTGFVGKWLYDYQVPDTPVGFNYWAVTDSFGHLNPVVIFNDGSIVQESGNDAIVYSNIALDFLKNKVPADKPWLLFVCHRVPHAPYQPLSADNFLYQNADIPWPDNYYPYQKDFPSYLYPGHLYEGDSAELDQDIRDYYETCLGAEYSVDSLVSYLEEQNILDSTLIIFTSDNGYMFGEHELEKKILSYEESIRLPLFVRYPSWFAPGTVVNDEYAANIDIAPTLLDAAGIPDTFHMDGLSLKKLADGEVHRKFFFYEYYPSNGNSWDAVTSFNYKYIYSYCNNLTEEFYDFTTDPEENTNLIFDPDYAALVQDYRFKMDSLRLATGDTVYPELNDCGYEFSCYADADSDGYGNADVNIQDDVLHDGYVLNKDDCNDADSTIHPNATEICNAIDDNCNGVIDEGVQLILFPDADGDGFGISFDSIFSCTMISGYSTFNTDCDDGNFDIHPGVPEICNNIDDDCNGSIDDGLVFTVYYTDGDGDSYGAETSIGDSLCNNPGVGYSTNNDDCDDLDASVFPGAIEIPGNGIDDNCNGYTDEFGVGILSPDEDNFTLAFFPNPTNGQFIVYLQLSREVNVDMNIEVMNTLNQVVFARSTKLLNGKLWEEINLNDAANGVYFVRIIANDHVYDGQIVYQK